VVGAQADRHQVILSASIGGAVLISLVLIARPLLALLRGDDPTARPCPACEVTRVCAPALELVLGLLAGAWGTHVLFAPGMLGINPFTKTLLTLAPQSAWGGLALAIGLLHLAALPIGPWARLVAICASYLWWSYLAEAAWPLWRTTVVPSSYTALAMIAATAGVFLAYERVHARMA